MLTPEIFESIWKTYKDNLDGQESVNFSRGFEACFNLFKSLFENTPSFNQFHVNRELRKENEKLNTKIFNQTKQLAHWQSASNSLKSKLEMLELRYGDSNMLGKKSKSGIKAILNSFRLTNEEKLAEIKDIIEKV